MLFSLETILSAFYAAEMHPTKVDQVVAQIASGLLKVG
jgi:hypothetical protein